ncbi:hypothetical protein HMPREF3213_03466 [Heyndrickxia coagulans]|uniref:Uncharacterized protein n=1 Tax=Heyndrickxia coagulans TaxID=1398 RepID=A0A0C5CDQ2_HEYCO|nr:hypothetical protein SB48_HM08orf04524 [Heyndrickxia coagulans]KWZ77052.1 hypothetical protein HMPREF3213_03466 [Heyndrickxia coagulans]KYC63576.1 hypothetical protein B4100_0227 [Heyndrickxia coagulans]
MGRQWNWRRLQPFNRAGERKLRDETLIFSCRHIVCDLNQSLFPAILKREGAVPFWLMQ